MDFSALVKARLTALGYGQKDLARAVQVTDSYISQLLTRRKPPPGPSRTDIYSRMEEFLQLGEGELGTLAESERTELIRRKLGKAPEPLFREFRDLILRKCAAERRDEVRAIFEAQPFGTLERLVAQKLLDVVQPIARQELDSENWFRLAARVGARSHEEMRVIALDFLDADVFRISSESCMAFLDPLVERWSVDLESLHLEILLNPRLVEKAHRVFRFVEREIPEPGSQPALSEFLNDPQLASEITADEVRFLRSHRFGEKEPNKLYYYRALQNFRDPLHFHAD